MKMTALVSCALLAAFGYFGQAEASVKRCDSCYHDTDFREAARTLGEGSHFVYNLRDNTVQRWQIPYNPLIRPHSAGNTQPVKLAVPPAVVDELNKAHEIYLIGGSLRPIYNVPVSILDVFNATNRTAYDVAFDANLRAMIESASADQGVIDAVTGANIRNAIADLLSLATSYLGLRDQVGLTFKIIMSDGSSVLIKVELDEPIGEYVNGSARTPNGQLIPETLNQVQGDWVGGGGDNLRPMVNHLTDLGARLYWSGGGASGSGSISGISCAGGVCIITVVE